MVNFRLKCFRKTRILHSDVRPFAGLDLVINHELHTAVVRAAPNFMIALALALELTTMFAKVLLNAGRPVLCHSSGHCQLVFRHQPHGK